MKYALQSDERVEATPKAIGVCPCCGTEMIAKCGNRKVWHWAHKTKKTCDHWWENETQWHRDWKDHFPVEWQEVVHFAEDGEKHVADVKTSTGLVIEFQHSAITKEEVLSRTAFYQKIIWVVDGRRTKNDFKEFDSRPNLFPWKIFSYPNFTEVNLPSNAFPSHKTWQFLDTPVIFDWGDVKSDYWISDWHALAGRAVRGWFCVDKAELIKLLLNDKTFYDHLT